LHFDVRSPFGESIAIHEHDAVFIRVYSCPFVVQLDRNDSVIPAIQLATEHPARDSAYGVATGFFHREPKRQDASVAIERGGGVPSLLSISATVGWK
jgi:hypothetical protein